MQNSIIDGQTDRRTNIFPPLLRLEPENVNLSIVTFQRLSFWFPLHLHGIWQMSLFLYSHFCPQNIKTVRIAFLNISQAAEGSDLGSILFMEDTPEWTAMLSVGFNLFAYQTNVMQTLGFPGTQQYVIPFAPFRDLNKMVHITISLRVLAMG